MNDSYANGDMADSSDTSDGSDDAQSLYEMGQKLMDMAEAMGYSPDDAGEEGAGDAADASSEPSPAPMKKKSNKMDLAMSFLGK